MREEAEQRSGIGEGHGPGHEGEAVGSRRPAGFGKGGHVGDQPTAAPVVVPRQVRAGPSRRWCEDGAMSRARLDKDPKDVAMMFDDVAGKYDLTNDVLSLGQDRFWRRAVVKAVDARPGETVLDIAAGTGTSSEPFDDAGVHVVPADFSLGMLHVGNRRRPDLGFTAADATRLPFAD